MKEIKYEYWNDIPGQPIHYEKFDKFDDLMKTLPEEITEDVQNFKELTKRFRKSPLNQTGGICILEVTTKYWLKISTPITDDIVFEFNTYDELLEKIDDRLKYDGEPDLEELKLILLEYSDYQKGHIIEVGKTERCNRIF